MSEHKNEVLGTEKESGQETKEVRVHVDFEDGVIVRDLLRSFDSASSPAGQSAESARIESVKDGGYDLVWDVPVTPDEKAFVEAQLEGQDLQDKNSNLDQTGPSGKPDEDKKPTAKRRRGSRS